VLTVVRQRPGQAPYTGVVQILYGTIARDLTHYLAESEQSNTAVALGVQQSDAGRVHAAAGYFVHALPGASAEETRRAELNVRSASHPSELVAAGADARELTERLLDGLGHREHFESEVSFRCFCDANRVAAAVRLLGEDEIARTARRGEALEVRCEFCAESYTLEPDALRAMIHCA
jgi:molecular chaperone Hsp33